MGDEQVHGTFEGFADPTEAPATAMNVRGNLWDRGAIAQAHHWRALGCFPEIREQVLMISIRFLADARGIRMIYLFQRPRRGVESTPGVATGREPGPPIADVLQSARRQQAALEALAIGSAAGFADDPT